MTKSAKSETAEVRRFEASRIWQSHVSGGAVAGFGVAVLFCAIAGTMLCMTGDGKVLLVAAGLVASAAIGLLFMYPGNEVAAYPYAVEIHEGKALRLFAPLKEVYIPIEEVKNIRTSFLALGWIVSLSKRHGMLKGFVIHGGFAAGADIGFRCLRCEAQGMRFDRQILSHLDFGAPQTSNYDVCATREIISPRSSGTIVSAFMSASMSS